MFYDTMLSYNPRSVTDRQNKAVGGKGGYVGGNNIIVADDYVNSYQTAVGVFVI